MKIIFLAVLLVIPTLARADLFADLMAKTENDQNNVLTNAVCIISKIYQRHEPWTEKHTCGEGCDAVRRICRLIDAGMDFNSAIDYVCPDPPLAVDQTNFFWMSNVLCITNLQFFSNIIQFQTNLWYAEPQLLNLRYEKATNMDIVGYLSWSDGTIVSNLVADVVFDGQTNNETILMTTNLFRLHIDARYDLHGNQILSHTVTHYN